MSKNRKINITKIGNVTTRTHKFGSNYNKESIFSYSETVVDIGDTHEARASRAGVASKHQSYWNIDRRLDEQETSLLKLLLEWGVIDSIPDNLDRIGVTSARRKLELEYEVITGARQVGQCLFDINGCRQSYQKGDYKAALSLAIEIASTSKMMVYAINEPAILLGNRKSQEMSQSNTILTTDEFEKAVSKYNDFLNTPDSNNRKRGVTAARICTVKWIKEQFSKDMKEDSFRKRMSKLNK